MPNTAFLFPDGPVESPIIRHPLFSQQVLFSSSDDIGDDSRSPEQALKYPE
jgi:hypothetical protein